MSLRLAADKVRIDESSHAGMVYQTIVGSADDVAAYWVAFEKEWSDYEPVASEPTTIGKNVTVHLSRYKVKQDD